jgi:hypothetical protein
MANLGKFEGRFSTPVASGYVMTVSENGGTAVAVTVLAANSHYYLTSTTSMLSTISTALTGNATLVGTYSCTVSDGDTGTGKVTISATGVTTFAITWTDTALRDALGFTANTSGAATYTGSNASPYIWLPNQRRSEPPHPEGYKGLPISQGTVTVSPSGHTKILSYGIRYATTFTFRYIAGNKAKTPLESTTNESFETFWTNTIALGKPIRWHYDRDTDGTYVSYHANLQYNVTPEFPGFVGSGSTGSSTLWAIQFDALEYVG